MTEPSCFTVAELTVRWKCGERAVYGPIHDGRLKAFMVAGQYRVTMKEVKRFEGEEGNHETDEDKALAALDRLRS